MDHVISLRKLTVAFLAVYPPPVALIVSVRLRCLWFALFPFVPVVFWAIAGWGLLVRVFVLGGGVLLYLIYPTTIVFLLISVIGGIVMFRKLKKIGGWPKGYVTYYVVGSVTSLVLLLLPFYGLYGRIEACDIQNHQIGDEIVEALNAYHQDHGGYPESLEELTPTYLPEVPSSVCFEPYSYVFAYGLETCSEDISLLVLPDVKGFGIIARCNPETCEWSTISFLDGICCCID